MKTLNVFYHGMGNPLEKIGGTRPQNADKEYNFNNNIRKTISNNSPDLDKLSNEGLLTFDDLLKTVYDKNNKPGGGTLKFKQSLKKLML